MKENLTAFAVTVYTVLLMALTVKVIVTFEIGCYVALSVSGLMFLRALTGLIRGLLFGWGRK